MLANVPVIKVEKAVSETNQLAAANDSLLFAGIALAALIVVLGIVQIVVGVKLCKVKKV